MTPLRFVTLSASLLVSSYALAEPYAGKLAGLIATPSSTTAEIRVLEMSAEFHELNERLNRSANENKAWFEGYRKNLAPGKPMPYHQNLGISETEFQQLMGNAWPEQVVSMGDTQMSFRWREDEVLHIEGLPDEAPFSALLYEPVSDTIMTQYGQFTGSAPAEGLVGKDESMAWNGRVWTLNRKGNNGEVTLHFVMGRLKATNQSILIHEAYGELDQQPVQNHYVLVWD